MENNSEKIRHQIIANNEAMAEIERSSIKPRICFDFSKRNIFLARVHKLPRFDESDLRV